MLTLTPQQQQLFEFVKSQHGSQLRKYTGEPYHTHLLGVAEIVSKYAPGCVEVALCHDLFEDTGCSNFILFQNLGKIGYTVKFSYDVCGQVGELTDKFYSKAFPYLNRDLRKECEARRLGTISYLAQTVKYADLIHNTSSIVEYDCNFAKIYLKEKARILELMRKGNTQLLELCEKTLAEAIAKCGVSSDPSIITRQIHIDTHKKTTTIP